MQSLIMVIQQWIGDYGFLGVFAAGIVEELISPIPSSLVQGFAGTILFTGQALTLSSAISFIITIPVASALGVTIGSLPYVWASRVWGLKIVDRYGKYISVERSDITELTDRMHKTKWDEVLFVGLRAFPLIPNVALAIYGGITNMPLGKYMMLSMIGVFIRGVIIGSIGWFAGNQLTSISEGISILETIGMASIIILCIAYIIFKRRKKQIPQ